MLPVNNQKCSAAFLFCSLIGTATDLGDDDRLAIGKVPLESFAIGRSVPFSSVVVNTDKIKEVPINIFNGGRPIGDRAMKDFPDILLAPSQESVPWFVVPPPHLVPN